jgi:hypothetical protein
MIKTIQFLLGWVLSMYFMNLFIFSEMRKFITDERALSTLIVMTFITFTIVFAVFIGKRR